MCYFCGDLCKPKLCKSMSPVDLNSHFRLTNYLTELQIKQIYVYHKNFIRIKITTYNI